MKIKIISSSGPFFIVMGYSSDGDTHRMATLPNRNNILEEPSSPHHFKEALKRIDSYQTLLYLTLTEIRDDIFAHENSKDFS